MWSLLHDIEYSSLCYIVGPCLSILNVIYQPQLPWEGLLANAHEGFAWPVVGLPLTFTKGKAGPGLKGLVLVFQLVAHVFLHALLCVDPLLLVHAEQGSGGHSNGDSILGGLGLQGMQEKGSTSDFPEAGLRYQPFWELGQGEIPGPASALRSPVLGRDRRRSGSPQ